jgi:hypothetical protein
MRNPLLSFSKQQLLDDVDTFAAEYGLQEEAPLLRKAALVAQAPLLFEEIEGLDDAERAALREEKTHRFRQPKLLYFTVIMNSIAAAIQGWDQTGSNGANLTFGAALGIPDHGPVCEAEGTCERNGWIIGFINSCPYIAIALLYVHRLRD